MDATAGSSSSAARSRRGSASSQSAVASPRDDRQRAAARGRRPRRGPPPGRPAARCRRRGSRARSATSAVAAPHAEPGSGSPKSTTCGRSVPPQYEAVGRAAASRRSARARSPCPPRRRSAMQRARAQVPVHLDRVAAGRVVQAVDVLRDDARDEAARPRAARARRAPGCARCSRRRAARPSTARRARGRARACRRGRRPSDRGAPRARPGERKSGRPLAVETPAPGERDDGRVALEEARERGGVGVGVGVHAGTVAPDDGRSSAWSRRSPGPRSTTGSSRSRSGRIRTWRRSCC